MATYTSNYGWTKPSGSDNVDISVLNDNLDDQDSTIHDAFLNMAPPFSESSTYAVDDIVLYGTGLYKCHTAVVTPGSWTGSTNWQVYKLSEGGSGGGGGTSNYNDLTNKPSINGVTLSGNKTTSDLGIDKIAVGLGNVPNVSTNDQTPTFTEASTRNNIASGEKLSVIMGKIAKFFNDLKTVAFSGSFTDLTNKPENANTFQGTIAEWNQLTTAEKKAYDHASIPDSIDGGVIFPANKVVMTGGGNVEDAVVGGSITVNPTSGYLLKTTYVRKIGKSVIGCINPRKSSGYYTTGWNVGVASIVGSSLTNELIFPCIDERGNSGMLKIGVDGSIDVYVRSESTNTVYSIIYFEV